MRNWAVPLWISWSRCGAFDGEQNPNPFAVVVVSHLQALATRRNPQERLRWKLRLVKGLYRRGFKRQDILELFHTIDWFLALSEGLEEQFKMELIAFEEERGQARKSLRWNWRRTWLQIQQTSRLFPAEWDAHGVE